MAVMMGDADETEARLDYPRLYFEQCGCAGPQPSRDNPRLDQHVFDCPYRVRVEHEQTNEGRSR